jgi:hypothetical protein
MGVWERKKILVYTPCVTAPAREVVDALLGQTLVPFFDIMISHDNPYGQETREDMNWNIQLNYEKMRQTVLRGTWDKVWIVEHDTIPPRDGLAKLLETDALVVSGIYILRHNANISNLFRCEDSPGIGTPLSWKEIADAARRGPEIEVSATAQGCVLLDRAAIEEFSFSLEEPLAPDMPMCNYFWKKKIKQVGRLDVACGHKDPDLDGAILYPTFDERGYETRKVA